MSCPCGLVFYLIARGLEFLSKRNPTLRENYNGCIRNNKEKETKANFFLEFEFRNRSLNTLMSYRFVVTLKNKACYHIYVVARTTWSQYGYFRSEIFRSEIARTYEIGSFTPKGSEVIILLEPYTEDALMAKLNKKKCLQHPRIHHAKMSTELWPNHIPITFHF